MSDICHNQYFMKNLSVMNINCQYYSHCSLHIITVPISTVEMASRDVNDARVFSYVDNQDVVFQEGDVRQWVCRVNGSFPEPKVVMKLEDIDITDRFVKKTELKKSGNIPGMQVCCETLLN